MFGFTGHSNPEDIHASWLTKLKEYQTPLSYVCTVETRYLAAAVGVNMIEIVPLVPLWSWHVSVVHGSTLTLFIRGVGF